MTDTNAILSTPTSS